MHELAFGITSNNGEFGPVRNVYDHSRIAGGSLAIGLSLEKLFGRLPAPRER